MAKRCRVGPRRAVGKGENRRPPRIAPRSARRGRDRAAVRPWQARSACPRGWDPPADSPLLRNALRRRGRTADGTMATPPRPRCRSTRALRAVSPSSPTAFPIALSAGCPGTRAPGSIRRFRGRPLPAWAQERKKGTTQANPPTKRGRPRLCLRRAGPRPVCQGGSSHRDEPALRLWAMCFPVATQRFWETVARPFCAGKRKSQLCRTS